MSASKRRSFLFASGALLIAPFAKSQPPAKHFRIGVLQIDSRVESRDEAFLAGLRERGYVPGRNIVVDFRYAEGNRERT